MSRRNVNLIILLALALTAVAFGLLFSFLDAGARADGLSVARQWIGEGGVWGVGEGENGILIFAEPGYRANIPESIAGTPVRIKISHPPEIQPLRPNPPKAFREIYRPRIPAGSSVGPAHNGTGTLTGWFWDPKAHQYKAVSNNHVFCDISKLPIGTPLMQPGWKDYSDERNAFALIEKCPEILHPGDNLADAASAEPLAEYWTLNVHTPEGPRKRPTDYISAFPGQVVCKSGRTTGYICGKVEAIHAEVVVLYGPYDRRGFKDQIITTHIGDPGDSGSLVVDQAWTGLVGQNFAGNEDINVISPLPYVLKALGLLPGCPEAASNAYPGPQEEIYPPPEELEATRFYRSFMPGILIRSFMKADARCHL